MKWVDPTLHMTVEQLEGECSCTDLLEGMGAIALYRGPTAQGS